MVCREVKCTEIYVLVRTVTYAVSVARLFQSHGLSCRQVKSPRELGKGGCGYAVAVRNSTPEVVDKIMSGVKLPNFKVYSTVDGKTFEKYR